MDPDNPPAAEVCAARGVGSKWGKTTDLGMARIADRIPALIETARRVLDGRKLD